MAAVKHQYRRGTAAQWLAANPVLGVAEPGYDTDAKKFKIGDGVTAWTSLQFVPEMTWLIANYLNVTARGAANGVASLDAAGLVPLGQLNGAVPLFWQPNTVYKTGVVVISPGGMLVKSKLTHTSGAAFSGIGANWAAVALGQSVVVRTNLVRDPRGMVGTDWSVTAGGGTPTKSLLATGGPAEAASFVRATASATGWTYMDARNLGSATNLVTPGKTYALSAGIRASYAGTAALYVQWLDGGGSVISTTSVASGANTANTWQRFGFVTAVAPANAVRALLIARVNGAPALNDTLDVTAMLFCEVSEDGSYFDGSTTAGPEITYAWTNGANASTSTASSTSTALAQQSDVDKMPKGRMWLNRGTTNTGSFSAVVVVSAVASYTFKAGRKYRIVWDTDWLPSTGNVAAAFIIGTCATTDALASTAVTQLAIRDAQAPVGNISAPAKVEAYYEPSTDQTVQVKFLAQTDGTGGTMVVQGNRSGGTVYAIYDEGAQY